MTYPASVIAKELQAVWDLRTATRPSSPTTKTVGVDALPAGVSIGTLLGYPALIVTAAASLTGWDARGYTFSIQTNAAVTLSGCKIKADPNSGLSAIYSGTASGHTPNLTLSNNYIDGATNLPPTASTTTPHPPGNLISAAGTLTLTGNTIVNASGAVFNWDGPGVCTVTGNYFGGYGLKAFSSSNPDLNSHAEVGNLAGGTIVWSGNLIDCDDNDEAANAIGAATTQTGLFLWQPRFPPLSITMSGNIHLSRSLYMYYAVQASDPITVTLTDNIWQKPTAPYGAARSGGYLAYSGSGLSGSGNIDFDTGLSIDVFNVGTVPPPVVAPPPPPRNTAAFPPTMLWALWDCPAAEIAQAKADGIANCVISPTLDWAGGQGSGPGIYNAAITAGFYLIVGPGTSYPSPEYSSNTVTLARDSRVIGFYGADEPTPEQVPALNARFDGWQSQCNASGVPLPRIMVTVPSASILYISSPPDLLNMPRVGIWAGDEYAYSKVPTSGEDLGLRGTADFSDALTSTQEGYFLKRMMYGPGYAGATGPLGKPAGSWVGTCALTAASTRHPSVGQTRRSIWSNVIMGSGIIPLFTTNDAGESFQTRYQFSPGIKAAILAEKTKLAQIEAAGFLIKSGGGRIPVTPLLSMPASTAPNGSVPSPLEIGATGAAASGGRLPYGIEGVQLWNEAGTAYLWLFSNITAEPRTLDYAPAGISGLVIAAESQVCLTSALADFWSDAPAPPAPPPPPPALPPPPPPPVIPPPPAPAPAGEGSAPTPVPVAPPPPPVSPTTAPAPKKGGIAKAIGRFLKLLGFG